LAIFKKFQSPINSFLGADIEGFNGAPPVWRKTQITVFLNVWPAEVFVFSHISDMNVGVRKGFID
jgi:hypothetical protein